MTKFRWREATILRHRRVTGGPRWIYMWSDKHVDNTNMVIRAVGYTYNWSYIHVNILTKTQTYVTAAQEMYHRDG